MTIFQSLCDIFYPPYCVACERFGSWFCERCVSSMGLFLTDREREPDAVLDAIVSVGPYGDPRVRSLVTSLKFRGGRCVTDILPNVLHWWKSHRVHPVPWSGLGDTVVTWVPTDPSRADVRGYDHAQLIAETFHHELVPWMPIRPIVERCVTRGPQSELPDELRGPNMRGVFRVRDEVVPRRVILIDDVVTTGSTATEVARTLKKHGVEQVYLWTLASGR